MKQWILGSAMSLLALAVTAQDSSLPAGDVRVLQRDEAVRLALANAAQLQLARIDQLIAAADVRQARASLFPAVGATGMLTYNSAGPTLGQASFLGANAIREYQGLIGASQTVSVSLAAALQRARAGLAAARAGTEVARRQLVVVTEETYFSLSLAETQRKLADDSVRAAERFEAVTRLMFNAGEIPESDLNRARLQTESRRSELQQSIASEVVARESLRVLIGESVDADFSAVSLLDATSLPPESRTAVNLERQPALQQLQALREAAEAEVWMARGDRLPSVTWSVGRGFDTDSLRAPVLRQHRGTLATVGVSWAVFDWGAAAARQAQARLRVHAVDLQSDQLRRELNRQYRSATAIAESAEIRVRLLLHARDDAERNLRTAEARYKAGEGSIIEVTDAQSLVVAQRTALHVAMFDYATARSQIESLRTPVGAQP